MGDALKNGAAVHRIVFVSRLDADCSLGAHLLCEIAPQIHQLYPDTEIILVGGGSEYPEILQKSIKINNKINCKLINAVGKVENPSDFFTPTTLFVGVSRAAIEAMAHGLPVILLGNEGYLGLLTEQNLPLAQRTNFTCRGRERATAQLLFDEIIRYFSLPEKEKNQLFYLSKSTVRAHYSAEKMALRTIEIYQKAIYGFPAQDSPEGRIKIAICGYYGHKNFGDEAILRVILRHIGKKYPHAKICVINGRSSLPNVLKSLKKADIFIFGGGSLLQNSTSNASLFYYLGVIFLANLLCRRKIMLANGFGPIFSKNIAPKILEKSLKMVLNTFDFISVRDKNSQKILKKLLPERKIELVPDPASIGFVKINQRLIKSVSCDGLPENTPYFAFCFNSKVFKCAKISPIGVAKSLEFISKSLKLRPKIVVLNENEDLQFALDIQRRFSSAKVFVPQGLCDAALCFRCAKFVISGRYHGVLLAFALGTPILALSGDPKIQSACEDFLNPAPFPFHKVVNGDSLLKHIQIIIEKSEKIAPKTCELMKISGKKAEKMLDYLI